MTGCELAEVKYSIVKKNGVAAWGEAEGPSGPARLIFLHNRALADIAADSSAFQIEPGRRLCGALAKEPG